jgi:hypothetical protein
MVKFTGSCVGSTLVMGEVVTITVTPSVGTPTILATALDANKNFETSVSLAAGNYTARASIVENAVHLAGLSYPAGFDVATVKQSIIIGLNVTLS